MKRWLLGIVIVVAACKGKDKDKGNDKGSDEEAKPAPASPDAATARPTTVADASPAAAPAPDAAPVAVAPAAPPTTCTVGEPVKIATTARTPGDLDLAVTGDLTAVAWFDGGKSFVAVATDTGQLVAEPANLGDNKETFLLSTPPGFAVVTITQDHCEMSVRTLDRMGVLGPAKELAKKVCNPQSYPLATVRDGQVLVVTSYEYEAEGLTAIRWRDGGAPETTTLVKREIYAAPAAVAATDTGFAVAWYQNEEDPMELEDTKMVTLDDAGVASKVKNVKGDAEVALLGATSMVTGQSVVPFAGRSWSISSKKDTGPWKVVALAPDGKHDGAGFESPGKVLAHDGARGAVASWDKKDLRLHALTCAP